MVTLLIVWGAIPFVTITVYAGPRSGAARARRGGRDRRRRPAAGLPRRHLPDPEADLPHPHEPLDHLGLRRLHAAVPADRRRRTSTRRTTSMGVYVYIEGYAHSNFGRGAAISLLMLLMVAAMSVSYVRRMVKMGRRHGELRDRRRRAPRARSCHAAATVGAPAPPSADADRLERGRARRLRRPRLPGLTGWSRPPSSRTTEINGVHADLVLAAPDARALPGRDGAAVLLGRRQEQPHRRRRGRGAVDGASPSSPPSRSRKYRFTGRKLVRRPDDRDPHAPAGRARSSRSTSSSPSYHLTNTLHRA